MRSLECLAGSLVLLLCACVQDPPQVINPQADAGSDISGAATPVAPTSISSGDVDEAAGGAECLTANGAPYVAPKC